MKNIYIFLVLWTPSVLIGDPLPYREQLEADVCEGVRYINPAQMKIMVGTKKCLVDASQLKCATSGETGCVAMAPFQAVALSSIDPTIIKKGESILGVIGTLDDTYQNPACKADMQTECQVTAPFKAAAAAQIVSGNFKDGEPVLGLTGSYSDPNPVANCTESLSADCFVAGRFKAVANAELLPGHIKTGIKIGATTGTFPSVASPLPTGNASQPQLMATTFNELLAKSTSFTFYDSHGNEYLQRGSANLKAFNIAHNETIFGVSGTAQPLQNIEFDKVRMRADLYGGQGKMKTDCRNGFPSGTAPNKFHPSIADDGSSKPPVFKGKADNSCHEELWENVTENSNGDVVACENSKPVCEYRDKQTRLIWAKDRHKTHITRDQAAAKCAQLATTENKPWRLPTHKELLQAYVHGISYIAPGAGFLDKSQRYWSSSKMITADPAKTLISTYLVPGSGKTFGFSNPSETANYMCVR